MTQMKSYSNAITRMFSLLGRKFSPEMIHEWAKHLESQKLSNEIIGMAYSKVIGDPELDPYKLTIAKFLSYVKPAEIDPKAEALVEWENVISWVKRGKSRLGMPDDWQQRTVSATNSVGGLFAIGDATNDKLSFIRNAFIKAYVDFSSVYKNEEKQIFLDSKTNPQLGEAMEALNGATKMGD